MKFEDVDLSPEALGAFDPNNQDNWSPYRRGLNEMVQDDAACRSAIFIQMQQLIERKVDPTFEALTRTRTWIAMSMNLTPGNVSRYEASWRDLYKMLMEPVDGPQQPPLDFVDPVAPAASVDGDTPPEE